MNIYSLTNIVTIAPPASDAEISDLEGRLNFQIPPEYNDLLRVANGFELTSGLVIYFSVDVAERNNTFAIMEQLPGYVAVGDDSGGKSIVIRVDGSGGVFTVDHGAVFPDELETVGLSLSYWVDRGCPTRI